MFSNVCTSALWQTDQVDLAYSIIYVVEKIDL